MRAVELIKKLVSADRELTVEVVGYSQGGIAALGCALSLGDQPWFRQCTLLNPTLAYWPMWLNSLPLYSFKQPFSNGLSGPNLFSTIPRTSQFESGHASL